MGITGKNGSGKTTLFKALGNIINADFFSNYSSPYTIKENSEIIIQLPEVIKYSYNKKINKIDTKDLVPLNIKDTIYVELPIPHGQRFQYFRTLSEIDKDLRAAITFKKYNKPNELIKILSNIYIGRKFDNLIEVNIKNKRYYAFLNKDNTYTREDYFSSGEYFTINLYKIITDKYKFIFIDEIEISLDAQAQVNLIKEMRNICEENDKKLIFTTHSIPILESLNQNETYYFDECTKEINELSFNHIKSLLFGYKGNFDKYILTEDEILKEYISYTIKKIEHKKGRVFNLKIKTLTIGTAQSTYSLFLKNEKDKIFDEKKSNVSCILDKDVTNIKNHHYTHKELLFIPYNNIESILFYEVDKYNDLAGFDINKTKHIKKAKSFYRYIIKLGFTNSRIFEYLDSKKEKDVDDFEKSLTTFLNT